jgi:hypothetical protein
MITVRTEHQDREALEQLNKEFGDLWIKLTTGIHRNFLNSYVM